jgi:hypothetical protein
MMQYGQATCLDTFALRYDVTGHVLEKATWCDEAVIAEWDMMEPYSGHKNALYGITKRHTEYVFPLLARLHKCTRAT